MTGRLALARLGLSLVAAPATSVVTNIARTVCAGLRTYHEISIDVLNLIEPR